MVSDRSIQWILVGIGGTGSVEDRLGTAAHQAGLARLTEGQRWWAMDQGLRVAPVERHLGKVQVIGIARLHYRPHTSMTAAWFANLATTCEHYLTRYLADPADGPAAKAVQSG